MYPAILPTIVFVVRYNHSGRKIPILSWRSSCYINHDELVVFIFIWAVLSGVIMCIHYHAYNPVNCTAPYIPACMAVNSSWPSDAIWRQGSRLTLVQAMACCLMAPSHCLNQCWLTITEVQWCSSEGNYACDVTAICHWNELENYFSKILSKFPRGQWVKLYTKYSMAWTLIVLLKTLGCPCGHYSNYVESLKWLYPNMDK